MRTRVYVAILVTIALGFLVPPSINLNRFRPILSESLSQSLGRQVSIQDVHLRLLPMPGFTFRQLRISDDEEFSAEPILQTADGGSVATLRLTSLWRGRFEIASVSLTQASLNLVRSPDGHWNLERLVNRAAQVPSAPTTRKEAEARARFPYIEIKESRINFKFGTEKKPFTLSDAEFALWLAAENRWNVRLKAVPLRTDESISDTGTIKLTGSFDRASDFSRIPFHFQLSWEHPEVNAITQIARGHDPGWRGAVELNAELKGTPADFGAKLDATINEFRRYDIARATPFDLRVSCEHRFRREIPQSNAMNQLDFRCKLPLDSGTLIAEGELHPVGKSPDFSVRLFASEVPVSSFLRALLHAKSTLPNDLSGEGSINGSWSIVRAGGKAVIWNGSLTANRAVLRSHVLEPALVLPRSLSVNFEPGRVLPSSPSARNLPTQTGFSRAVVEPFTVDMGGEVQVSAAFDPTGYRVDLSGPLDWQRLLQVARVIGLQPPVTDLRGSGVLSARYSGGWQGFAPPVVAGQAQIRSAVLSVRGFSEPLNLSDGSLQFDNESFHVDKVAAAFPRNKLEFLLSFSGSRKCERHLICDITFSLHSDDVREAALRRLLSVPSSGFTIPFVNPGHQFGAKWLLEIPASGSITAQLLTAQKFEAKNVSAQLKLSAGKLLVNRWTADIFDGKYNGDWVFDFSGERPSISSTGSIRRARMDQVSAALDEPMGSGNMDLDYRLNMDGANADQLAASATGSGVFNWRNGAVRSVDSKNAQALAFSFAAWSGRFTIAKSHVSLQGTKMMIPTQGVREVNGDLSFNRKWNLKFVRENSSGFVANGNLASPAISNEAAKVAEAR
ncbi:MAG TPA: AsmA family protein [Terriglobales bacterium]|nr:AsmA family protein [Terriglobales bacterium]